MDTQPLPSTDTTIIPTLAEQPIPTIDAQPPSSPDVVFISETFPQPSPDTLPIPLDLNQTLTPPVTPRPPPIQPLHLTFPPSTSTKPPTPRTWPLLDLPCNPAYRPSTQLPQTPIPEPSTLSPPEPVIRMRTLYKPPAGTVQSVRSASDDAVPTGRLCPVRLYPHLSQLMPLSLDHPRLQLPADFFPLGYGTLQGQHLVKNQAIAYPPSLHQTPTFQWFWAQDKCAPLMPPLDLRKGKSTAPEAPRRPCPAPSDPELAHVPYDWRLIQQTDPNRLFDESDAHAFWQQALFYHTVDNPADVAGPSNHSEAQFGPGILPPSSSVIEPCPVYHFNDSHATFISSSRDVTRQLLGSIPPNTTVHRPMNFYRYAPAFYQANVLKLVELNLARQARLAQLHAEAVQKVVKALHAEESIQAQIDMAHVAAHSVSEPVSDIPVQTEEQPHMTLGSDPAPSSAAEQTVVSVSSADDDANPNTLAAPSTSHSTLPVSVDQLNQMLDARDQAINKRIDDMTATILASIHHTLQQVLHGQTPLATLPPPPKPPAPDQ